MPTTLDKRATFRKMHETGCFVIPNPFDVGSAKALEHLGFKALASTSAGFAWSIGKSDNHITLEDALAHLTALCASVGLPVNADFEGGFAHEPEKVAVNVARGVKTGVAGLSIEDSTGDAAKPLYDRAQGIERIKAARAAIDQSGSGVVLTARAECFLVGHPDPLKESLRRLEAYAGAGADCLYAPGPKSREHIQAIVKAVAPKPVNLLVGSPGLHVAEIRDLGVRRISVGGALARSAWTGFMRMAKEISEQGSFGGFADIVPFAEFDGFYAADAKTREKTS